MCGIVGYIGNRQAYNILIEGLYALEYRGYDSAGMALSGDSDFRIHKMKGKVDNLAHLMSDKNRAGNIGISHTRWATHGEPSQANAHPHVDYKNKIALVHNGIIENYRSLKEELEQEGVTLTSETDTEVLAQLIGKYYIDHDLPEAVRKALSRVEGAYGIVVMAKDNPDMLVGARSGSPLVMGVGDKEYIIASDPIAIASYTNRIVYLKENHIAVIERDKYATYTLGNQKSDHKVETLDLDVKKLSKNGFDHFMLKEIFEQPETIENAMRGRLLTAEGTAKLDGLNMVISELRRINRIIFVACGTSYNAAMVGEYVIEDLAGIPVEVEYASEFRYRNPIIDANTLVFAISQSGETADTLAAMKEAANKGATVLGICNGVGSSVARGTHGGVYLRAGPEISVASTKAFTSQLTVIYLVMLVLGRMRHLSSNRGMSIADELVNIPEKVNSILKQNDEIKKIAKKYSHFKNFFFMGRSYSYPVALEAALKLKEISYIPSEGYPAAEMKHGPIALVDENLGSIFIAPKDSTYEKIISSMQEVRARKGKILAIATEGDTNIKAHADDVIYIPKTKPILSPLLSIIPLQLLAYHIAVEKGCEIDQPRNLAKSVTVE